MTSAGSAQPSERRAAVLHRGRRDGAHARPKSPAGRISSTTAAIR